MEKAGEIFATLTLRLVGRSTPPSCICPQPHYEGCESMRVKLAEYYQPVRSCTNGNPAWPEVRCVAVRYRTWKEVY